MGRYVIDRAPARKAAPVAPAQDDQPELVMPAERLALVEEFGLAWSAGGSPRMEGRVIGYLLLSEAPHVSAGHLARELHASAGSMSTTTRRLEEAGFIHRHAVPGDRRHHYRMEDDVWGSFLAGERKYLFRSARFAEDALDLVGPGESATHRRLQNMRDYFEWLAGYHRQMLAEWAEVKARRDAKAKGSR
jgi:hypothetical protein